MATARKNSDPAIDFTDGSSSRVMDNLGNNGGSAMEMDKDNQTSYRAKASEPKVKRFHAMLKAKPGDLLRQVGDKRPQLIISLKYLDRMNEQLERVVIGKQMGCLICLEADTSRAVTEESRRAVMGVSDGEKDGYGSRMLARR
ncbi:hypothetical protein Sjap_020131 [Stephania japonica]|uniref:Uncharacterized protein n=1 Tax=Stephania japonica TaxID=461633 RepID=A0AAP0F2X4_9MAGN